MANTGAYTQPAGGVAQPITLRYAYGPSKYAAYAPARQVSYAHTPYTAGPSTPDLTSSQSQPESYMSTVWKDKLDSPAFFKTVMVAALFLVLLTAAVAAVVMLMTGPSAFPTEATKDDFRDFGAPVYIRQTAAQKAVTVATAAPRRPMPMPIHTVPPKFSPPLNTRPMVCTVGSELHLAIMLPEDGLCDYLLYDSMYKDGKNLLLDPSGFQKDLRIFIDSYYLYDTTAFGIAFAFKSTRHLKPNLGVSGRSPLSYFWDRGIFHFGIVDTPTNNLRLTELDAAMECLKIIDTLADTERSRGYPSFIFFALVLLNYTLEDRYEYHFKHFYQPDVVITQGHYYTGDNMFIDCRVLPPTVVTRPPEANSSYRHDLTMAVDTIRKLSRLTNPDKRVVWAVSVTMKARWTTLLRSSPFEFLARCTHNPSATSFDSYGPYCVDRYYENHFTYSAEQGAMMTRHDTERRILSYDNEAGLCKKLCRVQGEQPSQRFGIAAFDLDYEDFWNNCRSLNKYGKFSRLLTLRRIVDFFRTSFKTDADEAACQNLVT